MNTLREHCVRNRKRSKLCAFLLGFGALLFAGEIALAHGDHQTDFSAYEIFLGVSFGNITRGATFACWTHEESDQWLSPGQADGGLCGATVNYQGKAGIGNTVNIIGGRWFWQQANGTTHHGRVLGGQVEWPPDLNINIDCGPGVARFFANISLGTNAVDAGEIAGCLDDTHGLIPPRLWGTLTVN